MAISTYAELKASIQNWSKRPDVLSVIDDLIDLTESDLWQRLKIRDMEARANATADTTSRFLALPTGFLEMRRLSLINGSLRYEVNSTTPNSMNVKSSGIPVYFTVTSQLEFDRTPASAYTVEMEYYKSLDALSASNTANAVLTRFPMIYLYGALKHFGNWSMNDDIVAKYSSLFDQEIDQANKIDRRGRFGPAPAMRTERPTP